MTKYINTFQNFISKEALSGVILFLAAVLAVFIANSSMSDVYYKVWDSVFGITIGDIIISMTVMQWINDGLMALFFLMIGLEIKRELIIGELSSVKKASFPVVAAIGGMVIPAMFYIAFNSSDPRGFGIPMATDIAFALGILMLLGTRVNPALKLFLVALAVVDDLGAIIVVATVYTQEIHSSYFLHAVVTYALILALNFKRVKTLWPYLILGVALWIFIHSIGIHATIAGVLLAFAIPISSKTDEKDFIQNSKKAIDEFEKHIDDTPILNHHQIDALENIANGYDRVQNPLVKLEHNLHGFSAFCIMPLFAFANAGVIIDFSAMHTHLSVVLGVITGLLIGKPIGVFGLTYLAAKFQLIQKPKSLSWGEIVAAGFLGGIGFTMSIFITQLAFEDTALIGAVKLAIFIASLVAAVIGVVLILIFGKKLNN